MTGELFNYREYLTHFRGTLERKCAGLSPAQLATRSVPPSPLSECIDGTTGE